MGLFSKKPKTQPIVIKEEEVEDFHEKRYRIPYTRNFRGYKKFFVKAKGNEESERNNKELNKSELFKEICKSKILPPLVEFVCFDQQFSNPPERMAQVFINGLLVGAVFIEEEQDRVEAIEKGIIEAVHIEQNPEGEYLQFIVKYKDIG